MIRSRYRAFFIPAILVIVVLGLGGMDDQHARAEETARIGVLARRGAEECLRELDADRRVSDQSS